MKCRSKIARWCALVAAMGVGVLSAFGAVCGEKTEVMFFFDAEDFTCDRSSDAMRDLANLLTEEGVRGHFAIVGYLAQRLVQDRRFDVIDALKPHLVGTQTLGHSVHPDSMEICDIDDAEEAYRRIAREEARGIGMIEAAFGKRIMCAVPPGNSKNWAAMYAYAEMGVPFYCDTYVTRWDKPACVFANQRHMGYCGLLPLESFLPGAHPQLTVDRALEVMSQHRRELLYMHPHMALKTKHWDGVNYNRGNNCEWGKWKPAPDRDPADTKLFYERLRAFIRRLKADARFRITDLEEIERAIPARRPFTAADVPAIRAGLLKQLGPLENPQSACVADAFQLAVRLLRGEKQYVPGLVYGFLEQPRGVTAPVRVTRAELEAAAKTLDIARFLPATVRVGGTEIGPADFLMAALETLETGAAEVAVEPKEQLGDFKALKMEMLRDFNAKGWVHTLEFKDATMSNRHRWQLWTLRYD